MAPTILVVEDESVTRQAMQALLEGAGYHVASAANGAEALSYLHLQDPPALILLDMLMPLVDGWNFLAQFRQQPQWAQIPIVIITGATEATDDWAASLGAAGMIRKPVDFARLFHIVGQYVQAGAATRCG